MYLHFPSPSFDVAVPFPLVPKVSIESPFLLKDPINQRKPGLAAMHHPKNFHLAGYFWLFFFNKGMVKEIMLKMFGYFNKKLQLLK